jgi:hypothetical protein
MKIKKLFIVPFLFLGLTAVVSCGNSKKADDSKEVEKKVVIKAPEFSADSAYAYIQAQADFGPRVPNTQAHRDCGEYLAKQLEKFGAKVYNQYADLTAWDGTILKARNIIGAYKPESKKRVMLCAHWDSRPYADNDPNKSNHRKPIAGADDGAGSVAVLLEIARQIGIQNANVGVDFIFFDAEDYGTPYFYEGKEILEHDWALGAQYWAKNPHTLGYRAEYGILLDMVCGKGSSFPHEQVSMYFAPNIVKKIWNTAESLGYGAIFPKTNGGSVIDDHYYINLYGIPCVDIIAYYPNTDTGFPPYWHTIEDDMRNIDKNVMKAVGQTVLEVIYNE